MLGSGNSTMSRNAAGATKSSTDPPNNPISASNAAGMSSNPNGNRSNNHHHHHHHNRSNNRNRGSVNANANPSGDSNGSGRRGGENLNHLLRFQLAPRARPPAPGPRRGANRKAGSVPFNKERYVNAQYRFLVNPTGDYTALFADADIFLNWSDILQVIIPTTTALSATTSGSSSSRHLSDHEGNTCPICLSKPVAPRMTKCGHVFCYACILQYLIYDAEGRTGFIARTYMLAREASGLPVDPERADPNFDPVTYYQPWKTWKKCPICWDSVYAKDLKAVRWFDPSDVAREHEEGKEEIHQGEDQDIVGKLEGVEQGTDLDSSTSLTSSSAFSSRLSDSIGPLLSMRLIERPHLTTLALPKSSTWPPPESAFQPSNPSLISPSNSDPIIIPPHSAPWHFQPDVLPFAKFMLATPDLLLNSLREDLISLEEETGSLKSTAEMTIKMGGKADNLSLKYVEMAKEQVKKQIERVSSELDVESVRSSIGKAKNDLKEFKEILKNSKKGRDERRRNVSRKQLKKEKERERNVQGSGSAQDTGLAEKEVDEASDRKGTEKEGPEGEGKEKEGEKKQESISPSEPQHNDGLQQYLALRSQGLGGSYTSPLPSIHPRDKEQAQESEITDVNPEEVGSNRSNPQPKTRKNLNPPSPSSSSYLFYQASSGQPIYLNPLDIKILQSEYKSYSNFPQNLKVKVSGSDEGSVNEELRKKHKYLSHLPMAAELVFVEVDWEAMIQGEEKVREEMNSKTLDSASESHQTPQQHFRPIISKSTLSQYENALRQRKNKRRDKSRREDKARSKAEGGESSSAREIREAQLQASLDGDPELGRSFGSKSSVGNGSEFGRSPNSESGFHASSSNAIGSGPSPSFREQALWGAERHFETHPGGSGDGNGEDFPDVLSHHHHQQQRQQEQKGSSNSPSIRAQNRLSSKPKKTVWGTQSFSSQQRSGGGIGIGSGNEIDDETIDEAWLELEEDYVVGTRSGYLKEGRGLNKQTKGSNSNLAGSSNRSNAVAKNKGAAADAASSSAAGPSSGREGGENELNLNPSANTNQAKKKKAKKLVLTAGGRCTG